MEEVWSRFSHRRHLIAAAAVVLLAAVALVGGSSAAATGADWPQARGSAGHTGWNSNESTLTKSNVKNLKPGWGGWGVENGSPG